MNLAFRIAIGALAMYLLIQTGLLTVALAIVQTFAKIVINWFEADPMVAAIGMLIILLMGRQAAK